MPRSARIVLPGVPHHVVTRGNNRRRLFSHARDYLRFIAFLSLALRETSCVLHQISLMSNHVHLGISPPTEDGLAALMKSTCQRYSQYRNRQKAASGKLFEQRYYSEPMETERYLAAATLYADVNAFRAELVPAPENHRWSTCAIHAGCGRFEPAIAAIWTPSPWYLSLGESREQRAEAYREAMAAYVASWHAESGRIWTVEHAVEAIDGLSTRRYTHRLQRPDGTGAQESGVGYVCP